MVGETIAKSGTADPIVGIRSDVYERRLEMTWMTKDDIETFESRLEDKTVFENMAIFCLSAAAPLGIDKLFSYLGDKKPADLAILLVCVIGIAAGLLFHLVARSRRRKAETFKERLFREERLISRTFSIVDTSGSAPPTVRVA